MHQAQARLRAVVGCRHDFCIVERPAMRESSRQLHLPATAEHCSAVMDARNWNGGHNTKGRRKQRSQTDRRCSFGSSEIYSRELMRERMVIVRTKNKLDGKRFATGQEHTTCIQAMPDRPPPMPLSCRLARCRRACTNHRVRRQPHPFASC